MRKRYTLSDIPAVRKFIKEHTRLCCVILALVAVVYGINRYLRYQEKQKIIAAATAQTQGEVVRSESKNGLSSRKMTKYRGVVEFEVEGKKYTAYTAWQTTALVARKQVTVHYDPNDPSRNYTDSNNDEATNVGMIIAVGLFLLVVVILLIDYYKRHKNDNSPLSSAPQNTIEQTHYDDIFK